MDNRNSFTNQLGFVLAAAGSAVGLGNIWRFPYLAARNGGGLFLLVYILLAFTFGFTLLITEIAIGRKTKESALTAYAYLNKKWAFLGIIAFIIPFIILPYYNVIGGWVLKYALSYITLQGGKTATDGFFGSFITSYREPVILMGIFSVLVFLIIYNGVEKGIEKVSKILMPILVILVLFISIYALTISHTLEDGTVRKGLEGAMIYFVPNLKGLTISKLLGVFVDAMGQLFYSLSIAMGIMVTYGSYMKKEANIGKAINRIEIFDTGIAILAGLMIIPTVYVFNGIEGMKAGPSLMFVSLPKVFQSLGHFGFVLGAIFFIMVFVAALTSAVSISETITSSLIDKLKWSRKRASVIISFIEFFVSLVVCFGYNIFYFEVPLPVGGKAQILDLMDYVSNNVLMPVLAISTCILIGWIYKPGEIVVEIKLNGYRFHREKLYRVMIKYITPVLLLILFLKSIGIIK